MSYKQIFKDKASRDLAKQLDEELSRNNLEEAIRRNKQCQIEKRNMRKWKRYINK